MTEKAANGRARYVTVDGTTWPTDVADLEWRLRYAPESARLLVAASVVAAYRHLTDPAITQTAAFAALRRARAANSHPLPEVRDV